MPTLSIDFETRSTVDLKKTGVYVYAAHPTTDIWCMAWAFDDEEPEIWTPDDDVLPARVREHILGGGEIRAWNAQFERIIWNEIMDKRYGLHEVELEQWVCSAAEAAAMALPRSLDKAAEVTGAKQQKDDSGYRQMLQMSRPRRVEEDGTIVWWDTPAKIERLFEYCKQDVRTERAIVPALRRLTPREREVYLLDQEMNDHGIRIDRPLILAAKKIADEGLRRAGRTLQDLTGGVVSEATQVGQMKTWLASQGVEAESLAKAAVRELLDGELPEVARQVIEARAEAGRSSVAKLDAMLAYANDDDYMRGLLMYHAASTGRWGGKGPQPHNYPRGEIDNVEHFIPLIMDEEYDLIDMFAPPLAVVSSLLRGMLVPSPGNEFVAADYSAIEARVLNWLAGQDDILALFAAGEDVYKHNAARLYGIALSEVQKFPHRQTGKFQELGCGFQMGAKKAVSAAKEVYQLELTPEQAKEIVDAYRQTHQAVVGFWYDSERALIAAVENPGVPMKFGGLGNLTALKAGAYLYIILPSKRPLCYAAPRVVEKMAPWGELKPQVEFSSVNPKTNQWGRSSLYGGLIVENIVQAVARDIMVEGMFRGKAEGYTPVLSVHDEVIAEVPAGFGSVEEFEQLLATPPEWAVGCPIATEGWRGTRYRK